MDPPDSCPVSRRTALSAGGVSLLGALGVGSLVFSTATAQPTEIDECTVIDEDGEYELLAVDSGSFAGGDTGSLTVSIPEP